ncbi:translation initiation factor IF-2-like [Homo sapiens]|uniref:translation initiation factor IF-2-like n=1 Tax=Homo sapiens TaxID=9606 RepID=UPI001FB1872B|nr:translation initiation factor IF-2-like [Homo sapiens]
MWRLTERRRKAHRMLKLYNGLSEGEAVGLPAGPDPLDPTDLNGAHFDPEVYLDKLPRESPLAQLMDSETDMVQQIRALDSDMQTLVYENYDKFIPATEMTNSIKLPPSAKSINVSGIGRPSGCNLVGAGRRCRAWPERAWPQAGDSDCLGQGRRAQRRPGPGVSAVGASGQQRAPESNERPAEEPTPAPMPSSAPRGPTEPALRRPSSADRPLAPGPSSSPGAGRAPGAMASPSGSSKATGKPRGRDGRPRREEDDVTPEEKRLRLLLEEGSAQPDDGEDAPRPGRKETGTQTGGDGRGRIIMCFNKGSHGFDNVLMDMKTIFRDFGPDFKRNGLAETFNSIHIYPFVCKLLGVTPKPTTAPWQSPRKCS